MAGEARVATEQADRPAISAVAIGIAALEAYALTRQTVQLRRDGRIAPEAPDEARTEALHNDQQDIGPLRA